MFSYKKQKLKFILKFVIFSDLNSIMKFLLLACLIGKKKKTFILDRYLDFVDGKY